jgi:ribokinase
LQDYALISRIRNSEAGHAVVVIGGLYTYGTEAVDEFLTDPQPMRSIEKEVPLSDPHSNVQITLGTTVTDAVAGSPGCLRLGRVEHTMPTMQRTIVVVGSINIDLVVSAERMPAAGETVSGSGFQTHFGGKGANQAVAVARLSYPVEMIGKLGSDVFGEHLRAYLASAGVGMEGVATVEGSSGTAVIVVDPLGENRIVVVPGANAQVTPDYLDLHRHLIRDAGMVLTQLEIPVETVERLAAICAEERVPLMLDPAPPKRIPASVFEVIRWLTPNETEADFYVAQSGLKIQENMPDETASCLLRQGAAGVILKMGSHGAYLATRDGIREEVKAFPVTAVDTTAAGDAFNGAFAVGLMLGKPPAASARFAAAAAALSVTRQGAQDSMTSREEVDKLLGSGI